MNECVDLAGLPCNQQERLNDLSEDEQRRLRGWIAVNLVPVKYFNPRHNSYSLKHVCERALKTYISNGAFKGAMLAEGFRVRSRGALNWVFNISSRSPAVKLGREVSDDEAAGLR